MFSADDLEQFRSALKLNLESAWAASPNSKVLVSFSTDPPPQLTLSWSVKVEVLTLAEDYDQRVKTRTQTLFGKFPDAKIFDVARALGAPAEVPILDVGAGTGRNTLPLSRAGFPTDAVELGARAGRDLARGSAKEALAVQVFEHSIFDPKLGLALGHYRILLLAEVRVPLSQFDRTSHVVSAGREALAQRRPARVSAFLSSDGYKPDDAAREMSQILWCNLFTRRELQDALADEPLQLISDESVQAYERATCPLEAWPPTVWFETWTGGQDLFDLPAGKPPMELRWLVYRKS